MVTKDGQRADCSVWSPDAEPKEHIGDGDFGDFDLGALLAILAARPQAVHVHLLGLGPQGRLVSNDSLDDGVVEGCDEEQGEKVVEDVGEEDECSLIDPRGKEVIGAGEEQPLGHVVAPAGERGSADEDGVAPDYTEDSGGQAGADLLTGEPLHNDVVSIVTNQNHGHDRAGAKDGSKASIEATS